ncbi:unnamed protein product [Closterium sp. Yama58-4]|nr:unnamed protein product [Closterium sp. Yama58-4]
MGVYLLLFASHIMPADPISDQSFAVKAAFRMNTKVQMGPGLWRLPAYMIGRPGVRKVIEAVEKQVAANGDDFELLISRLNAGLIAYATEERKHIWVMMAHLQHTVADLKQAWLGDPSCARLKELLDEREAQLKSYWLAWQERHHVMAGMNEEVMGEVASPHLSAKIKYRKENTQIKELSAGGVLITENKEILGVASQSEKEVQRAFHSMAKNKASGRDGLPKELFEEHWDVLGKHFMVLVESFTASSSIPASTKDVVTILLHKKGGRNQIENYRPITLLSFTYKVLARVVPDRMKRVLHEVISPEQYSFLPGRRLSDAVGLVADVIDAAKNKEKDWYLLLVDFRKVFDSVSMNYLFMVLERIGFPSRFVGWIRGLHEGTQTRLLVNGWLGEAVEVVLGVTGLPASALPFLICRGTAGAGNYNPEVGPHWGGAAAGLLGVCQRHDAPAAGGGSDCGS